MAMRAGGNSVTIYAITTGAMAAEPMPTTNRATSINSSEGAMAVSRLPRVYTSIPSISVLRRPMASPSLPNIGAQAAVDMAVARAVQVALL